MRSRVRQKSKLIKQTRNARTYDVVVVVLNRLFLINMISRNISVNS